MSVTDFTNLINVDVDVFVVSTPNESERKSNKRIRNGFQEISFELQAKFYL